MNYAVIFDPEKDPKLPNFDHFHQKWRILNKLSTFITFLTKFMPINQNKIFLETFRDKNFHHFPQILNYEFILAPKMSNFWPFSPKMTYFDRIGSFCGLKWRQKILSLKFIKTISVRYISINLVKKNVINGVNLDNICHFLWTKLGHFGSFFGGTNDGIGQNFGKLINKFYL